MAFRSLTVNCHMQAFPSDYIRGCMANQRFNQGINHAFLYRRDQFFYKVFAKYSRLIPFSVYCRDNPVHLVFYNPLFHLYIHPISTSQSLVNRLHQVHIIKQISKMRVQLSFVTVCLLVLAVSNTCDALPVASRSVSARSQSPKFVFSLSCSCS